ncbi:hypothetical protein MTR67_030628 [Solanum verrucosum]|uniref:Chromo domain-containing protein n=1 Tax=Solanum verrucosum TaxID=315347 RepID=A0AAF0R9Q2_SOLVR|nr:hypothetical protein MTR67_030628 [Solanum verrucosum]
MLDKDLQYEEESIAILDRDVRKLRTKEIKSVQLQWKYRPLEEATWETERDMRDKYPQLFIKSEYNCDYDFGLLNGSGVAFRHTNSDRLPRSDIMMGSVATFRHKHWIWYYVPVC